MSRRYTNEQLQYLRTGYREMQIPELTCAFNEAFGLDKTEGQIKSTLTNHGFTCGRPTGTRKGAFRAVTLEQAQFLQDNYRSLSLFELTVALNDRFNTEKTQQQVRAFTRNHRIKSGRTGQFEKGHTSWNAGTKGLTGPNSGSFNKGDRPKTWRPLGSERICPKDGYVLIKVAEQNPYTGHHTRYRFKHVVVWEREHGPVPPGMVVSIIDGDKTNCEPENLELISRAELLYLNQHGYNELPDELKPSMRAMAKLETKQFSLSKSIGREKTA